METEEWRTITGWEGYEVSNEGRVRSWKRLSEPLILRTFPSARGAYPSVTLWPRKLFKVYELVVMMFLDEADRSETIRHLDGNVENSRADNLKWGTWEEQVRDRVLHGTDNRGERHGMSKLTKDVVLEIRKQYGELNLSIKERRLKSLPTQSELATSFNVSREEIGKITRREIWLHV